MNSQGKTKKNPVTARKAAALPDANVVDQIEKEAYQVDIYTLMEKRWVTWRQKPYANEDLPAQAVGNPFTVEFSAPPVAIGKKITTFRELLNTRYRTQCLPCAGRGSTYCTYCSGTGLVVTHDKRGHKVCSSCDGNGRKNCRRCALCGYVIRWAIVNVEWNGVHSVSYHQNAYLSNKIIHRASAKEHFYECEEEYDKTNQETTQDKYLSLMNQLINTIDKDSVVKFWPALEKQYFDKHLHKLKNDMQIRKMKVHIERLAIAEIDYSSGTYVNKKNPKKGPHVFTFLQYGRDKKDRPKKYEDDYPLSDCGCFTPGCACQSCCCTIS